MAAETSFTVIYEGPDVDAGRMDVRELAPSLLALGDLFREANEILSPESPAVSLQITATDAGSFEVGLILAQPEVIDRLISFFSGDQVGALVNLKELVIGGPALSGCLIALIKRLRRRTIVARDTTSDPSVVRLTLDDNTTFEVPPQVLHLYGSVQVRRDARQVVRPLTRGGINQVLFRSADVVTVRVEQQDVEAFEVPEVVEEPLLDHTVEMNLSIASVAFVEGNKWRFSDGERTFFAGIADDDFSERVDSGQEAFRKGDILRCELRMVQARTEDGLSTSYEVTRVLEHIPASTPLRLPGFDDLGT